MTICTPRFEIRWIWNFYCVVEYSLTWALLRLLQLRRVKERQRQNTSRVLTLKSWHSELYPQTEFLLPENTKWMKKESFPIWCLEMFLIYYLFMLTEHKKWDFLYSPKERVLRTQQMQLCSRSHDGSPGSSYS